MEDTEDGPKNRFSSPLTSGGIMGVSSMLELIGISGGLQFHLTGLVLLTARASPQAAEPQRSDREPTQSTIQGLRTEP